VVGSTFEDARSQLQGAKLNAKRNDVDSDKPVGQVIDSNPKAGARVAEGAVITLNVSNGKVEIPDVTSKTAAEARRILNQKGFFNIVINILVPTDDFTPGTVFDQNPVGGSKATTDQQITLKVAKAKPVVTATTTPPPTATTPVPTTTPPTPTTTPPPPP
jgi:serine/threonine-protein kinase